MVVSPQTVETETKSSHQVKTFRDGSDGVFKPITSKTLAIISTESESDGCPNEVLLAQVCR
jgi:hypothetical protein